MPTAMLEHSRKRIDRCGKAVRNFSIAWNERRSEALTEFTSDELQAAIDVVEEFRAYHARPLGRVNAGLRYYIKQAGMRQPDVTQRLKRFSTIVHKLRREPTMALSKMEDIAGVRAILQNQQQADHVCTALMKARKWTIRRIRNYTEGGDPGPKADGYRALHVVVEKDGCYVEIQLRTPWQDRWAQSVEQDTRRLREELKFGSGPDDLRMYYQMVSELFAMRERHIEVDQDFMEDLAKLYSATRRYFPEPNGESKPR